MLARYQNLFLGSEYEAISQAIGLSGPGRATCTMLVFLLPLVLQVEAQKTKIQYEKTTDSRNARPHAGSRRCELYGRRS